MHHVRRGSCSAEWVGVQCKSSFMWKIMLIWLLRKRMIHEPLRDFRAISQQDSPTWIQHFIVRDKYIFSSKKRACQLPEITRWSSQHYMTTAHICCRRHDNIKCAIFVNSWQNDEVSGTTCSVDGEVAAPLPEVSLLQPEVVCFTKTNYPRVQGFLLGMVISCL